MSPPPKRPPSGPGQHRFVFLLAASCMLLFVLLAVAVLARHGRPFGPDTTALNWAVHHRPATIVRIATLITDTGQGLPAVFLALLAGLSIGYAAGHAARRIALDTVAALIFIAAVQALRYGLAEAIGRHRPPIPDRAIRVTGFAFPSGHTTTSAAIAGLFVLSALLVANRALRAVLITVAVTWAITVGLSRVYLGVHWPTDVLGGWLFATALFATAVFVTVLLAGVWNSARPPRSA